ncbi:aspartyl-phosphate phosphatase Spo0E family protein [Halobacillus salinarum]|uniref:Aspartyl-phosphate phosphatase Spo0E family protein n=1 Tax=Halobacillus salinarum TaxID=2932257 RepID=A0ABY4EIR7_9BACI|nr:aspartyl-phosphate phosphatase Spo0E family protein [Halobacillus salinarum]UOQ43948.1 aspartyl-phosphate phosphatase Spo0E family protein [Halobacillus salinarum]
MDYKLKLEQQIEDLREVMYQIYYSNPQDEELLQISQELDGLLNKWRDSTRDR